MGGAAAPRSGEKNWVYNTMSISWDDLPFPFLVVDEQDQVLAGNRQAASDLRCEQPDLVGRSWPELLGQKPTEDALLPLGFGGPTVRLACQTTRFDDRPARVWTWQLPPQAPSATTQAPLGTILVAEDEESIRDICRRVLTDSGYRVLAAANGRDAVELLEARGGEIDLVLADVVMPGTGGEAIFEYLQSSPRKVPVIYTSGYAARNSPAQFLEGQEITLLRKPYSLSQLLETVRAAIASKA
jgi:CheY-like chemotaxis protein